MNNQIITLDNDKLNEKTKSNQSKTQVTQKTTEKLIKKTSNKEYKIEINGLNSHFEKTRKNSNKIESSKYTWFNIIPKILFEQFSNFGNIYFLILAILQLIPSISNSGSTPVNFIPLIFVVAVNGIKDAVEDYKRKRSDNNENKTSVDILKNEVFEKGEWEKIKLGNIIKIRKNEIIPCDCIILYTSNPKGVGFIETKSLDGETNLKMKESIKVIYNLISSKCENNLSSQLKSSSTKFNPNFFLSNLKGEINCDEPSDKMYSFSGNINIEYLNTKSISDGDDNSICEQFSDSITFIDKENELEGNNESIIRQRLSSFEGNSTMNEKKEKIMKRENKITLLEYDNILLRGSILMQTEYLYAIPVYLGHSSKIMMNSINAQSKKSKLMKELNGIIVKVLIIQASICIFASIINIFEPTPNYIGIDTNDYEFLVFVKNLIINFFSWFLNMQNIIPISLVVTMEMIKFFQAWFIGWDTNLYNILLKQPAIVQCSSLNEELGQIHHIFTDKTGTLTKNYMQFHSIVVKGKRYGRKIELNDSNIYLKKLLTIKKNQSQQENVKKIPHVIFNEKEIIEDWNNENDPVLSKNIDNIIMSLALCHTANIEKKVDKNIEYSCSSPDELALVNASRFFDVVFEERTEDNYIVINKRGVEERYLLKNIFEFNSDRKRMSVVLQNSEGKLFIYTKGADTVIVPRLLNKDITLEDSKAISSINDHLYYFGSIGLRTLLYSYKEISKKEYADFLDAYNTAVGIVDSSRNEKIAESYDILERELEYLGATAIEDVLQDNLQETLINLREAGIKFWMLTGDNPLTAVSIGHSSGLIDDSFESVVFNNCDIKEISAKLVNIIDSKYTNKVCFVVTGQVLAYIFSLNKKGLKKIFTLAILKSDCFIGCRVSPKQKAEIVLLVKNEVPENSTLAIGDGANDVNMISSAHVGIGIQGVEGTQASRASDFSIGQFSYLQRLMFIHGRESYRKNSFAVLYMLWKNFLYILPNVIYGFSTLFSSVNLYDPYIDILYNLLFTQFAIGWFSCADKEFQYKYLQRSPKMYRPGLENKYFNKIIFWKWYIYALFIGFIIYWIVTSTFINTMNKDNHISDLSVIGSIIYFNIVFYVNLKLILTTNSYEFLSIGIQLGSIVFYIIVLFITSKMTIFSTFGNWEFLIYSYPFYEQTLLILLLGVLMEYAFRSLNFFLYEVFVKSNIVYKHSLTDVLKRSIYKDEEDLILEKCDKEDLIDEEKGIDNEKEVEWTNQKESINRKSVESEEDGDTYKEKFLVYDDNKKKNENEANEIHSDNVSMTNDYDDKSVKDNPLTVVDNKVYFKDELIHNDYCETMNYNKNQEGKDYLEEKDYKGFAYISDKINEMLLKKKLNK